MALVSARNDIMMLTMMLIMMLMMMLMMVMIMLMMVMMLMMMLTMMLMMVMMMLMMLMMLMKMLMMVILLTLLLFSCSAETSLNYENEKDANSTGNGHVAASQAQETDPEQQPGNGVHLEKINTPDALSVGSSVNYFVPSDSDVEDDLQEALAGALLPSKIPQ